jgi:hypothetical protein
MNWPLTVFSVSRKHGLDQGQQVGFRLTTHVFDAGLVQAKRVAQLFGRWAHGDVDVAARRQTVDRQAIDDAQRHRLVCGRVNALTRAPTGLRTPSAPARCSDPRAAHQLRRDGLPELVVADQPRAIFRHLVFRIAWIWSRKVTSAPRFSVNTSRSKVPM